MCDDTVFEFSILHLGSFTFGIAFSLLVWVVVYLAYVDVLEPGSREQFPLSRESGSR